MNLAIELADSIMTRFPDPDKIPFTSWCYVQGYVLAGFEKLWLATSNPKYYDYFLRYVDQHVQPDGAISGFKGNSMDDMMAGDLIVAAYAHTGQEKYQRAADRIRMAFNDYPRNSDGAFWHAKNLPHEFWIDGVFMGGMFLSRYGAVFNDSGSFDEVTRQILAFARHGLKAGSGLFLHAYDEACHVFWADPSTGLSPEVWSEGLGWYALILVESLSLLPQDHPARKALIRILIDLAEGLRKVQDKQSGLWYQVVDKGDLADNWQDTSGSAMFIYTLQRAIEMGHIDSDTYLPVVRHGFQGLLSKAVAGPNHLIDILDACDGVCVQKSYADYVNFPKSINAKEAVGGVLWAATVMEKPGRS